jgi:hypothetical protein
VGVGVGVASGGLVVVEASAIGVGFPEAGAFESSAAGFWLALFAS